MKKIEKICFFPEENQQQQKMMTDNEIEMKKKYLLKRIQDEYETLKNFTNGSEISYILSQASENFVYSAPEVVDECFRYLKNFIVLDDNFHKDNVKKDTGLGLNIYGDKIKCYICESYDHVQKDCGQKK